MGRHQPPTNRSFYLSVAASTLRFAIIVALVVGGVVVINQAFEESPAGGTSTIGDNGGGGTTGETGGTGPTANPSESESPREEPTADPEGVVIAVFNGTSVTGLAADTQTELIDRYGYVAGQEVGDSPSDVPVTTIYYARARDRVEAEFLAEDFFRRLDDVRVARLPDSEDVDSSVQLAIYLGNDYAAIA
jgi:hypothetical protein